MPVNELWIKNFKSLRDVRLRLGQFNLVVGPNGAGKTNLIDALEFFREALTGGGAARPWRRWWRPENVVWMRDETLPLTFGFAFTFGRYTASYEVTCSVAGGGFRVEGESLAIKGWGRLERIGDSISVKYDEEFVAKAGESGVEEEYLEHREIRGTSIHKGSLILEFPALPNVVIESISEDLKLITISFHPRRGKLVLVAPKLREEGSDYVPPQVRDPPLHLFEEDLVTFASRLALDLVRRIVVVKPLNLQAVRKPQEYVKTLKLESDCANLYVVLYNLFLRRNRLPDRVTKVLSMAFKGYELLFDLTEDGRVFVKLAHNDLVLPPPCMPDSLHKLTAILTALELKPSILAIDRLEDSLHPHLVELVVDLLKTSGTTVIATTHSPAVIDIADPEDLILANMTSTGTALRRLRNPEKVREELRKYGITLSEKWLWGSVEAE